MLIRVVTPQGHQDDVTGIAFSGDGTWAATCARDNSLRLWNIATGTFAPHPNVLQMPCV